MRNIIGQSLNRFAYDLTGLNQLKHQAAKGSTDSVKQVAQQFESLFINMMMQSMRKAVPTSGLFNQSSAQLFTAMFDQQIAQQAAGKGLGLAEMLTKQLAAGTSPSVNVNAQTQKQANNSQQHLYLAQSLFSDKSANLTPQALGQLLYRNNQTPPSAREDLAMPANTATTEADYVTQFVKDWLEPAKQAAKISGIAYEVIIAQAALETGWGQKQITTADNQSSHNYFGIKATPAWQGSSTRLTTHEYINNTMIKVKDDFKVYNSKQHALTDYLNLLTKNPRYRGVVKAPDARTAAKELQAANYATDPQYSDKLIQIIARIEQIAANHGLTKVSGFKQLVSR